MTKPKARRINKNHSKIVNVSPKTRDLVECNCILYCNGKLVDPRTYRKHHQEMQSHQTISPQYTKMLDLFSCNNTYRYSLLVGVEKKNRNRFIFYLLVN